MTYQRGEGPADWEAAARVRTAPAQAVARGSMLSKMISLATERHAGQFDKGGRPYILHPLTVMHRLRTEDEELQCIAVGHDLLEDTTVTFEELLELGFSTRVVSGIMAMTKWPDCDYRSQVKANNDAVKVKMQDLRHNCDVRRLKGVTQKDHDRMARYHEFYLELQEMVK